jgi:nicotinamidase-related amidase
MGVSVMRTFGYALLWAAALMVASLPVSAATAIDDWAAIQSPPAPKLESPSVAAKSTALLILDIEERTCNMERRPCCVDSVPRIAAFLEKARAAGMPVAHSITNASTPEAILPPVKPRAGEPVVKASVDKFLGTDLEKALAAVKAETVIVCGTAAHGAVLHTATAAAQRKLKIVLPVDCLSAEDLFTEKAAVWLLHTGPATGRVTILTTLDAIRIER